MRLFWARIKDFIKMVVKFLTKDIWALDFRELSNAHKRLVKSVQALILTARGFTKERVGREAVALSQFTILAFIPMIALILFISHGFGVDRVLYEQLTASFPTSTQLIHVIMDDISHAPKSASWYHHAAKVGMSINCASNIVKTPIVLKTKRQLNIRVI